jgi:hypothetical protein
VTRNDNNGNYNITENDEAIMESCDDATSAADACKIEIVKKTFFKCHRDINCVENIPIFYERRRITLHHVESL